MHYLFIDEASQLSLDKLVAFAKAIKNVIFLGDQMQLPKRIILGTAVFPAWSTSIGTRDDSFG